MRILGAVSRCAGFDDLVADAAKQSGIDIRVGPSKFGKGFSELHLYDDGADLTPFWKVYNKGRPEALETDDQTFWRIHNQRGPDPFANLGDKETAPVLVKSFVWTCTECGAVIKRSGFGFMHPQDKGKKCVDPKSPWMRDHLMELTASEELDEAA